MGYTNKKTHFIDFVLTDRGKDLLAQNKLNIAHYAFSDELIDYSGSLTEARARSASLDDTVYKNYVAPECTSMHDSSGIPKNLTSFLYTSSDSKTALSEFVMDQSGTLNLTRSAKSVNFDDFVSVYLSDETNNADVVLITERDEPTGLDREKQYTDEQYAEQIDKDDKNFINLLK